MTLLVTRTGNYEDTRYVEDVATPTGGTVRWQLCEIVVGAKTFLAVATRDLAVGELQNFIIKDRLRAEKKASTAMAAMSDLEFNDATDVFDPLASGMYAGYVIKPAALDDVYVEFILGETNPAQTTA